ncbi:MAG: hypothetical protein V7K40_30020 [Nostoc sp.]|uniref:hypothetical protein n=1 Tax=Nostoc sp. TaxID=1180 RepID=UPI002FF7AE29
MPELTLQQVFGANATQDATTITIKKSDLPRLTASVTNTAEALFTGILLQGQSVLIKSTFDTNLDQSIYVEKGYPGFTFRGTNNDSYRVDTLTVNLAKPDNEGVIDPNDY